MEPSPQTVEAEIQALDLDLWRRLAGEQPGVFDRSYWTGRVLDWAVRDAAPARCPRSGNWRPRA